MSDLEKIETCYANGDVQIVYYMDAAGRLQGDYIMYHPNGNIHSHRKFLNGELHGESIKFYDSGVLLEECTYHHGEKHGDYKWWYENKQLGSQCHYVNGQLDGEFTLWHMYGSVQMSSCYKLGELVKDEPVNLPMTESAPDDYKGMPKVVGDYLLCVYRDEYDSLEEANVDGAVYTARIADTCSEEDIKAIVSISAKCLGDTELKWVLLDIDG